MCFLMFSISSFSQSYSVYIKNGDFIDDYNYKFDVVLKANENSLELTCYQGAIVHKLPDDNNIIFKYINGSSQLSNKPVVAVGLYNNSNDRSEEHTSELQSRESLVCRLLLETKKCSRTQTSASAS